MEVYGNFSHSDPLNYCSVTEHNSFYQNSFDELNQCYFICHNIKNVVYLAEDGRLPVSLSRADNGTRTPVAERSSTKSLNRGLFPPDVILGLLPAKSNILSTESECYRERQVQSTIHTVL